MSFYEGYVAVKGYVSGRFAPSKGAPSHTEPNSSEYVPILQYGIQRPKEHLLTWTAELEPTKVLLW
uniref:Uncharacterized protein n=1 Tax=Megaselia scalaris TaxID=36166 RepID=T1GEC8_MEGSC